MKQLMLCMFGKIFLKISSLFNGCSEAYKRTKFKAIGENVSINKGGIFTYENITIGSDVFIGAYAIMQSRYDEIIIGNHVAFGPCVHIFGGNHEIHTMGVYMKSTSTYNNGKVVIEDDVWIGSNVTILKGVRIGRGSVVAAGAIVSIDVPPYTIYSGVPDVKMRERFTEEEIIKHEEMLIKKG